MWNMFYFISALLLGTIALAAEDKNWNPDPKLNWRPENVTDLAYYLYGYTGSYYNGTTSFRMSPKDWGTDEDEKVCTIFRDQDIVVSFNSLVGVLKPNEYDKGTNPVMLLAKSWPDNLNLTPTAGWQSASSAQVNDFVFNLESISPRKGEVDSSNSVASPKWNLTTTYLSDTSYSLLGSSNKGIDTVQFNMSQCTTVAESWWGATLLYKTDNGRFYKSLNITNPVISGQFSNQSAFFTIKAYFRANSDFPNLPASELAGVISIDFVGQIDTARSDVLIAAQTKPKWTRTIGFLKSTVAGGTGGVSDAASRRSGAGYILMAFWGFCIFNWL